MRCAFLLIAFSWPVTLLAQSATLSFEEMRAHSAFRVPSEAMSPAIRPGEIVYVDVKNFQPAALTAGSVIAFKLAPASPQLTVKRVVALPGSTVHFRDWKLYVDNREVAEPYVNPDNVTNMDSFEWGPMTVKANCVFVLSDNRDIGNDSRRNGCVALGDILGLVKYVAAESSPQSARRIK